MGRSFMKRTLFKQLASLSIACVAVLVSRPSHALFETQYVYGIGPHSTSNSALPALTFYSPFAYLSNPALIAFSEGTQYSIAFGKYKAVSDDGPELKHTLLSLIRENKAYTVYSYDEDGFNRESFAFTMSRKYNSYIVGATMNVLRYSSPPFPSPAPGADPVNDIIPSDDGSGFSIELGAYKEFDKIRAGVSIQNAISYVSNYSFMNKYHSGTETKLPIVFNIGASYPIRDWADFYLGFKHISYQRIRQPHIIDDNNDTMIYAGLQYNMSGGSGAARSGYQNSSVIAGAYDDQALTFGADYVSGNYSASLATFNYLDAYNSPIVLGLSYKPGDKPWQKSEKGKTGEEIPSETQVPAQPPKPKYEPPLPAAESVSEPEPSYPKPIVKQVAEPVIPDDLNIKKLTVAADFTVDPKIILLPSQSSSKFTDIDNHWSFSFVNSISSLGFYPEPSTKPFNPTADADRSEFYRLLFLTQISRKYKNPISIQFKTPYAVSAGSLLISPALAQSVKLVEGTYERSGTKRLIVTRDILKKAAVPPGRYKLRLTIAHQDLAPNILEDYITILDTSIDFSQFAGLEESELRSRVQSLKNSLISLGFAVDYLDGLQKKSGLTRVEALREVFYAAGITPPVNFDKTGLFTDIWHLSQPDQSMIFLASRGMRSMENRPLMGGYPDNTFKPDRIISNAETAALIERYTRLQESDFDPPYLPPDTDPVPTSFRPAIVSDKVAIPSSRAQTNISIPVSSPSKTTGAQSAPQRFFVVSGSFLTQTAADAEMARLRELKYNPAVVIEKTDVLEIRHTAISSHNTREAAEKAASSVDTNHYTPNIIALASSTPSTIPSSKIASKSTSKSVAFSVDPSDFAGFSPKKIFPSEGFVGNYDDHVPFDSSIIKVVE